MIINCITCAFPITVSVSTVQVQVQYSIITVTYKTVLRLTGSTVQIYSTTVVGSRNYTITMITGTVLHSTVINIQI